MSKSKGNSIDPIEMVDTYGADAFRFTLAAFAAQGRDIKMSVARIEGYRHFVNKIWNTARFALMNMGDYDINESDYAATPSLVDRWILHRLNYAVRDVTRHIEEYRFNEAAMAVYQFFWHEFCDWYIEMIKPVLYQNHVPAERKAAQRTLHTVLSESLALLHPFMPFVTEELRQRIIDSNETIMESAFPVLCDDRVDEDAAFRVSMIKDIVTSVRNVRGVMGIPHAKKLRVALAITDHVHRNMVFDAEHYIINLANLEELLIEDRETEHKGAVTDIAGSIKIFIFLGGMIDVSAEKERLASKLKKLSRDHTIVQNKLNNHDFMEKASEEVVEKEKVRFDELRQQLVLIEDAMQKLKGLSS